MKPIILFATLFASVLVTRAQTVNPDYNKALADSMGGDANGMKMYVLAILKTGTTEVKDSSQRNSIFRGHMNNINRLAETGKLIVAGPLAKNDRTYRGIFILDVQTIDEAKALVVTDPAVAAGIFDVEYFNWYGSSALRMYMSYDKMMRKNL